MTVRLTETLRSLGRRWYVVLLGLALTAGLGLVVDIKVPATYQATGTILLMPPEATVGVHGNPYLFLGGLNTALDVLVRRASAVEVSAPVLQPHPKANYTVSPDRTTSSAIVLVEAESGSPQDALQLRDEGMKSVVKTLSQMQDEANVGTDLRIQGQALVVDKKAAPKTKTRFQLFVVVAGGGVVGTLLLASLIDGWLISRKLSRAGKVTNEQPESRTRRRGKKPALVPPNKNPLPIQGGKPSVGSPKARVEQPNKDQDLAGKESPATPLKVP